MRWGEEGKGVRRGRGRGGGEEGKVVEKNKKSDKEGEKEEG